MTLLSILSPKLAEAKKPSVSKDPVNGGIKVTHWFWGAAEAIGKSKTSQVPTSAKTSAKSADEELNDIVLQNPQISGATLINTMKTKGLRVSKVTESWYSRVESIREAAQAGSTLDMAAWNAFVKRLGCMMKDEPAREADSGSAFVQVTPAGVKEREIKIRPSQLRESIRDDGIGPTKFEVILIQEGMGNFGDAYYYSRKALESAIPAFTGAKIYADHPSTLEEETRPERSVRDVLGHFENIHIKEDDTGRAMLAGEVCILPDKPYEWARALMREAVAYAKKFPDKDLVGLSINAAGDSAETSIDEVLGFAPESAKPKLIEAKAEGITMVNVVSTIYGARSCDLVTEAGAGGKIINLIEGEKQK